MAVTYTVVRVCNNSYHNVINDVVRVRSTSVHTYDPYDSCDEGEVSIEKEDDFRCGQSGWPY